MHNYVFDVYLKVICLLMYLGNGLNAALSLSALRENISGDFGIWPLTKVIKQLV